MLSLLSAVILILAPCSIAQQIPYQRANSFPGVSSGATGALQQNTMNQGVGDGLSSPRSASTPGGLTQQLPSACGQQNANLLLQDIWGFSNENQRATFEMNSEESIQSASNCFRLIDQICAEPRSGQQPAAVEIRVSVGSKEFFQPTLQQLMMKNHNHVRIVELDASGLGLTDNDIGQLSAAIQAKGTVRYLYLHGNQITDVGAKYISDALSDNNQFDTLSIGRNRITDTGVQNLARLLSKPSLRYLYLDSNLITNAGARYLSQLLKGSKIQKLDLSGNQIGGTGALGLAWNSRGARNLQEMDVSSNPVRFPWAMKKMSSDKMWT